MSGQGGPKKVGFEEANRFLDRQFESVKALQGKAIKIVEFDLAVGGFIAGAYKLSPINFTPNDLLYVVASGLFFVLGIFFCIRAYTPVGYSWGVGPTPPVNERGDSGPGLESIRSQYPEKEYYLDGIRAVMNHGNEATQYDQLARTYIEYAHNNAIILKKNATRFSLGLWASMLGLLYIVLSLVRIAFQTYSLLVDGIVIVALLLLLFSIMQPHVIE